MQALAVMVGLAVASFVLLWIIRTLVDYRRWYRTSKVQTEVHTKLLDRFSSNEDLMAYMQTPSGRRFLESAPIPLEGPARSVGAPLSRILWSLQAGIVLAVAALGVLFVSNRVVEEVAQPLFAIGVLVLARRHRVHRLGGRLLRALEAARPARRPAAPRASTPGSPARNWPRTNDHDDTRRDALRHRPAAGRRGHRRRGVRDGRGDVPGVLRPDRALASGPTSRG